MLAIPNLIRLPNFIAEARALQRRAAAGGLAMRELTAPEKASSEDQCSSCLENINTIAGQVFSHADTELPGQFIHPQCVNCWKGWFATQLRARRQTNCPTCRQVLNPSPIQDIPELAQEIRGQRLDPLDLLLIGAADRLFIGPNENIDLGARLPARGVNHRRKNEGLISNFISAMIAVKDYIVALVLNIFKGIGEIASNIYSSIKNFYSTHCAPTQRQIRPNIVPMR